MKALVLLLGVLLPAPLAAQALPGDQLTPPWAESQRGTADRFSNITVTAALAVDVWDAWTDEDRKIALAKQAARIGAAVGLAETIKRILHRTRPDGSDDKSFFSEHTAIACTPLHRGGTQLALSLALCGGTGYLRVGANRHWLSDVLVGAAVGWLTGALLPS